jgi:hypothetical protein
MNKLFLYIIFIFAAITACKKDTIVSPPAPEPEPEKKTSLKLSFKAFMNNEDLVINRAKLYTNFYGDSLNVGMFKYYVSNVVLKKASGSSDSIRESYYLVDHQSSDKTSFTIENLPEGDYTKIEFLLGVDSARNVSGAQTGALDPGNLMFWDWNQGYVFFKMEGSYKSTAHPVMGDYALHVGGFSGPTNYIRKISLSFPSTLSIVKGKTPAIYFNTIADEVFKTPNVIDLDSYYSTTSGKFCGAIADNYVDMIKIDRIEN